ncbi:MAG: polysaccharide biosynthesis tyrosine autokinase [Aquabacterium sp.]|nr:polysaccharide biosynthesis tyrosine autokinase [Aquabacterium sp.]
MDTEVMAGEFSSNQGGEHSLEKSIGDIIRETNNLSAEQVENILTYQREHNVKFGEAAVALGLANQDEVLWALAQQFHYPYANQTSARLSDELVVANKPFCDQSEIFRGIRGHLSSTVFNSPERNVALAVISAESGDGKTFFAANMAVALSQLGGRTLLIDADMRAPRLHDVFKVESKGGLSGILSGRAGGNALCKVVGLPSLYVLPVGIVPPNPLELLQRQAFGLLLQELTKKFDHVIVDTPSASSGIDARVIAASCGAVLAIARKDKTRADALHLLLGPLNRGATKLVGVVMNER